MRELDAVRLRHQPHLRGISIERPSAGISDDLHPFLVPRKHHAVVQLAVLVLVGHFQHRPMRQHPHHLGHALRRQPPNPRPRNNVRQLHAARLHENSNSII